MSDLAKTHILFPKDLLKKIDNMVGIGSRSRFVIEASQEKLNRIRFIKNLKAAAGSWSEKNHPQLKTQRGVNRLLKKTRASTAKRLK